MIFVNIQVSLLFKGTWWRPDEHTAPESVKRVKSSAQILVKSFFWRLNAPNPLGGSSGHQRTPLLNACQKWSPLMTGATSKCICGVQPPEKWLNHYFCALLFTCPEQCGWWWWWRWPWGDKGSRAKGWIGRVPGVGEATKILVFVTFIWFTSLHLHRLHRVYL